MKSLAILISNAGKGSNLQAIIDAINYKKLNAEIKVVVSSDEDAYGLIRAKQNNIPLPSYVGGGKKYLYRVFIRMW